MHRLYSDFKYVAAEIIGGLLLGSLFMAALYAPLDAVLFSGYLTQSMLATLGFMAL